MFHITGLIYFDAKLQRIEGLSNDGMHELMQMPDGMKVLIERRHR
jgi:hypothetical protein